MKFVLKEILLAVIAIGFPFICFASPARNPCSSRNPCKFGGKCANGKCVCAHSCISKGVLLLCGGDGNSYLNYCFMRAKSCELQKEIKVECFGICNRCSKNVTGRGNAPSEERVISPNKEVCPMGDEFCFNDGLCLESSSGRLCRCAHGFEGPRCQQISDRSRLSPRSLRIKQDDKRSDDDRKFDKVVAGTLCLIAVMGFGVLARCVWQGRSWFATKQKGSDNSRTEGVAITPELLHNFMAADNTS